MTKLIATLSTISLLALAACDKPKTEEAAPAEVPAVETAPAVEAAPIDPAAPPADAAAPIDPAADATAAPADPGGAMAGNDKAAAQ